MKALVTLSKLMRSTSRPVFWASSTSQTALCLGRPSGLLGAKSQPLPAYLPTHLPGSLHHTGGIVPWGECILKHEHFMSCF